MIDQASMILDVSIDSLKEFEAEDTFNGNMLRGVLCMRPDHRYGALVIFSVNGVACEQIIYATPKLHYPFDKNGAFHWPDIKEVQAWEKLDGTNILAYRYQSGESECVTYKTRLTPTLRDMQYGMFESMWRELLDTRPWIKRSIENNPEYNLSFELYGSRNPITVQYEVALDASLLFGVRRSDAVIKPPLFLAIPEGSSLPDIYQCGSRRDFTGLYNDMRATASAQNNGTLLTEGYVLYAHVGEPSWRQFKCKPEEIEKIHWASGGIPLNAIWTTCINVFESEEQPDVQCVVTLLKEEFSDTQIAKSYNKIERVFKEAHSHAILTRKVNEAWAKARNHGLDVTVDKNSTMRFLSQFFDRNDMRRVGTIVLKQAGLI